VLVASSDSESDGCDAGATRLGALGFVSRATTTSCARICPAIANPQSKAVKAFVPIKAAVIEEFSAIGKLLIRACARMPHLASADHWTTLCRMCDRKLPRSARRARNLNYRQRKAQPQFFSQINLDVMQSVLLELHAAEIMDVGRVAFHLLQHKLNFRLRN
jgi:hypothetical protein